MARYDPLREHLARSGAARVAMTFREMETVLGFQLPQSARHHGAWWANERTPRTHVHKVAWQAAGYVVETVDRVHGRVTFVRSA